MDIFSLKQLPADMPLPGTIHTVSSAIALIDSVAQTLGFDTLYRVDIKGETVENKIQNTLYYRFESVIPLAWLYAGADNLAFQVEQEVIPALRPVLSNRHLITELVVTPFTPLFELKLANPYAEHVGLYGTRYAVDIAKTQRYSAKLRFNLSPNGWAGQVQNAIGLLPKTGRVYIGPLGHGDIGDGETVRGTGLFSDLEALAEKLADPLFNANPPGNFVPIRVKRLTFDVPAPFIPIVGQERVSVYTTWADVASVQVSTEVTYLRSREM